MLEVRGLTRRFGTVAAVENVGFAVPAGEIFGFIGPNGAGKTTTIRILATLDEPSEGEAFVGGHSVVDAPEAVRDIMGYMPDAFGVYDGITVAEYLEFFAAAYRLPPKRWRGVVDDVMALCDLGPIRDKLVQTLSKGMRQRLCLAKTLIHDPKVLILDEPAEGLDPRARIEIRALLRELGRMGKTILISSHILTELSDLCTWVGIIERGKLLAAGPIEQVVGTLHASRRYRLRFAARTEDAVKALNGCPGVSGVALDAAGRVTVDWTGSPMEVHKILKVLADLELPLIGLEEEARNLETLFLQVTKGVLA